MTATVRKGAVSSNKRVQKPRPKSALLASVADAGKDEPVAYISTSGADAAWIIPPRPRYDAQGHHIGEEPGVHLDFGGVGITRPYDMDNPHDKALVKRIDDFIKTNDPLVHELGLRKREATVPNPPFARWLRVGRDKIKATLEALMPDDSQAAADFLKAAAAYELAQDEPRADIIALLDSLASMEQIEADAFAGEVQL